jgi:hypothetical protein
VTATWFADDGNAMIYIREVNRMVVAKPRCMLDTSLLLSVSCSNHYHVWAPTLLHRRWEPCWARHGRRVATTSAHCLPRQQSMHTCMELNGWMMSFSPNDRKCISDYCARWSQD